MPHWNAQTWIPGPIALQAPQPQQQHLLNDLCLPQSPIQTIHHKAHQIWTPLKQIPSFSQGSVSIFKVPPEPAKAHPSAREVPVIGREETVAPPLPNVPLPIEDVNDAIGTPCPVNSASVQMPHQDSKEISSKEQSSSQNVSGEPLFLF